MLAFIKTCSHYCGALYVRQKSLARLQSVQNAAAQLLIGARTQEHVTPVLASLQWLLLCLFFFFVFKHLHGLTPDHLSDLLQLYAAPGMQISCCLSSLRERGGLEVSVLFSGRWLRLVEQITFANQADRLWFLT